MYRTRYILTGFAMSGVKTDVAMPKAAVVVRVSFRTFKTA
jgi:hypothetical protein